MYDVKFGKIWTVWDEPISVAFRADTNDFGIINSVLIYDEYLAKSFEYEDGDIFIDLGAHIGTWSLLMATLNPAFTVYSFEPIPENFKLLKQNVEFNKLKNMYPFNLAVSSDSCGTEPIYYTNDENDFGKAHKFVGSMLGGSGTIIEVEKISLNDIFENNNIESCKVIKCDCEGCESKAFSTLTPENFKKIENVVGEFHPWHINFETFFSYFEPYFIDASENILRGEKPSDGLRRFLFRRKEK